jgi:NADH:ubiquinone oxidoreductase subunit 3 (subunit A)
VDNPQAMKKQPKSTSGSEPQGADAFRQILTSSVLGQWLSIVFGLLFLFQCMILPLVGKAAMYGSGSPGAGSADTVGQNQFFFAVMLLVTLAVGSAAFYSKWRRHKADGSPFPKVTAGLLGLVVALLLVYVAGLLKI